MNCNLGNWDPRCEEIVNKQINLEFWASYQYHLMWGYFDQSEIGLENIAEFFKKSSLEEREHGERLMQYQNKRGGKIRFFDITGTNLDYLQNSNKNDVLLSFEKALDMEQTVYRSLLDVHRVAEECNDPQFSDFIESEYLEEQISAFKELSQYISQLQRIGENGFGVWSFDQEFKND